METKLLAPRLLKARESVCEVGGFKLIIRRPTQMEYTLRRARHNGEEVAIALEAARDDVVGWVDMKESDIDPQGANEPIEFDPVVYKLWIADQSDLWLPIHEHVMNALNGSAERLKALRGN